MSRLVKISEPKWDNFLRHWCVDYKYEKGISLVKWFKGDKEEAKKKADEFILKKQEEDE